MKQNETPIVKTGERNSNIELLRFIMMMGICLWHILQHGYGLKLMEHNEAHPSYLQIVYLCALVPSVNCFMFISGYYGIKFKKERLVSLFTQATFFFVVCLLVRNVVGLGEQVDNEFIIKNWFPLGNSAWWFLNWYVVIMILSPLLNNGGGQKRNLYIVTSLVFLNCFATWLNHRSSGSDLMGLLTIYLMGRYLHNYCSSLEIIRGHVWVLVFILSTTLLIIFCFGVHHQGRDQTVWTLLMYNNPLVVIQAISLFYFVKGGPFKDIKMFNFLGRHCFAIYLVTEFSGGFFYFLWKGMYEDEGMIPMFLMVLITSVVICLTDWIRVPITKKIDEACLYCSNKLSLFS